MTLPSLLALIALAQDAPVEIPKPELPAKAECAVCVAVGSGYGVERVAAGFRYQGKNLYLCNSAEAKRLKENPDAYLPPILPRPMPELSLADLSGKKWDADAVAGKVVLVDFWATWCGPCKEMFPVLKRVRAKYAAQGFEVLSVSVDEKRADLQSFLKKQPMLNPVLHDESGVFAKWRVVAVPTFFLVKDGQVVAQWPGKVSEKSLSDAVARALAPKG